MSQPVIVPKCGHVELVHTLKSAHCATKLMDTKSSKLTCLPQQILIFHGLAQRLWFVVSLQGLRNSKGGV